MKKTIMLMDIDGTLAVDGTIMTKAHNGFSGDWKELTLSRREHPELFAGIAEEHAVFNVVLPDDAELRIEVDASMINALSTITSSPHVECFWLTMWESKAVDVFAPFAHIGHDWDVIVKGDAPHTWKLDTLRDLASQNPDTQIVFLDDDVAILPSDFAILEEITDEHENVFALVPTPHVALTAIEVGWIKAVVENPTMVNALVCE